MRFWSVSSQRLDGLIINSFCRIDINAYVAGTAAYPISLSIMLLLFKSKCALQNACFYLSFTVAQKLGVHIYYYTHTHTQARVCAHKHNCC